jgi:beta-fructofuranosidase
MDTRLNPAALRAGMAGDRARPRYHFLPPANWMNDPNGLIQWRGQYHLFYQHNPAAPDWGPPSWGHAVSDDLVHWADWPLALVPTPGGPDAGGCWSGCAVDDHGTPTLIYTGVHPQVQCLATSDDGLLTWHKDPANPIVAGPPPGLDVVGESPGFRDPNVWREGETWYMLVGTGIRGVGGAVLLYRSADLRGWEYLGPACVGEGATPSADGPLAATGAMWECPSLFKLGYAHVLLISPQPESLHTYYMVGDYEAGHFTPATLGQTDFGPYFYAALTTADAQGRRLMWGWVKEGRDLVARRAAGWAGVMSLPRVLSLLPGGRLGMAPPPELAALRGEHWARGGQSVAPGDANLLEGVAGDRLEIDVTCDVGSADEVRLGLRCSPGAEEATWLIYQRAAGELSLDQRTSSLAEGVDKSCFVAPLALEGDARLRLRVFLDGSVIEIFANDTICLTGRVYPARADSLRLSLSTLGGVARVESLDVWQMASIW